MVYWNGKICLLRKKKPDVKYQHTALLIRAKYLWPSSGYMN